MVLSSLRPTVKRILEKIAIPLTGLNPNIVTLLSIPVAATVPILVYIEKPGLAILALLVSGFLDILDGALARLSGRTTRAGAYLDSMSDRVSDTLYYLALSLAGYDYRLVILALGFTITVTYSKARAHSLGGMEYSHRFLERSDRLIIIVGLLLVAIYLPGYMQVLMLIYMSLLGIAVAAAFYKGFKVLAESS